MTLTTGNQFTIKPQQYSNSIESGTNFSIQFVRFSREVEIQLVSMLNRLLSKHDRLYLRDPLLTILKELITNAEKANAKRLYFRSKGLDIHDTEQYRKGMDNFKEECLYTNSPIFQQLEKTDFRVLVYFNLSSDYPEISVMNNCAIRPEELHKIDARIRKAYTYNDITEAFGDVLDDSEGAGLGLIMSLLVFKSSGFDRKDFSVKSEPNRTIFSVRLSENAGRRLLKETITDEITAVVEYIPSFRENILRLIELCDSPEATIHEISAFIKTDPGLTSSILKQANSAGYLTAHRVSTIEEAVKKIGLSGIKTLATATGVDGIIHELFPQFKQQWETSQRKAFYAYKIAIQEKNSRISDKAYLAALISNIGTIALMSAKKEIMNSIATLTGIKDMSQSDLLEEITIGISHSTLSAVITERWNFNKDLSTTIKYHTRPHLAPEPLQDLVRTVYLAHILIEYQNKRIRYQSIDQEVLWYFNISSEEEFRTLNSILDQAFGSGEVKA